MIALIGWTIFLIIFYCFTHKCVKVFEHFLEKRARTQADDELFKYMLERHWESWAESKGIKIRKVSK